MKLRTFNFVALGLAAGVAVLLWWIARAGRATESARHDIAARRTELAAQLRRWETELAALRPRETPPPPPPTPVVEAKAPAPAVKPARSYLEWMEDPAVQVLYAAKERAELAVPYGPFFREQKLSAAQIDRLGDLIIQSRMLRHDLSELYRTKGRSFDEPAMRAQSERGKEEMKAGVEEVLGAGGYAKLEDYARALEVRTYVGKMAGAAAVEGEPLTLEQANRLAQVLAGTCPNYAVGGPAQVSRVDWKAAEAAAAGILSPAQMKLLRTDGAGAAGSRSNTAVFNAVAKAAREMEAGGGWPAK